MLSLFAQNCHTAEIIVPPLRLKSTETMKTRTFSYSAAACFGDWIHSFEIAPFVDKIQSQTCFQRGNTDWQSMASSPAVGNQQRNKANLDLNNEKRDFRRVYQLTV